MKTTVWENISKSNGLSEDFMREHKTQLDWELISTHQTLSETFIVAMGDKLNWNEIARTQALSEPFLEKYINVYIRDIIVFKFQNFSLSFLQKYQHVNGFWTWLSMNKYLTEEWIEMFLDKINGTGNPFRNYL